MKSIKRVVAGSLLALGLSFSAAPVFAANVAQPVDQTKETRPVLVWCITCGTHHLIDL